VRNFIAVPFRLERLIAFGLAVCTDTFLYVLTYLPLRAFRALLIAGIVVLTPRRLRSALRLPEFRRSHYYDLMHCIIVVCGSVMLAQLQMSRVYHYIRGQHMIKLYVVIAMMEVLDRFGVRLRAGR
jgi:hypothetical protein